MGFGRYLQHLFVLGQGGLEVRARPLKCDHLVDPQRPERSANMLKQPRTAPCRKFDQGIPLRPAYIALMKVPLCMSRIATSKKLAESLSLLATCLQAFARARSRQQANDLLVQLEATPRALLPFRGSRLGHSMIMAEQHENWLPS